ncbi:MAG TPA: hypothetical protein PKX92_05975 [Edaphocola sp.]|nr:hypothetical protein [Edaphocola sp.]
MFSFNNWILFMVISGCSLACGTSKRLKQSNQIQTQTFEIKEKYNCNFAPSIFEGDILCFGNDCIDQVVETSLDFQPNQQLSKILKTEGLIQNKTFGQWTINEQCIVHVRYENMQESFFIYRKNEDKLELLNAVKEPYSGNLLHRCYLKKIKIK